MWEEGLGEEDVLKELHAASRKDMKFKDGNILGSMCTEPLAIAKMAHFDFIETNLGNAGLYPGTKLLEDIIIGQLATLLNGEGVSGHIVSGGTEANITALWIARNTTGKKEVIFPKSAHFSFFKACDILSMKPVSVPLTDDFVIDIDKARKKVNKKTAAIVGIAGTTELGMIDSIEELASITPDDAFLHVDAAFGGFVIPFLDDMPKFDFKIPEVSTLTVDPHKMGMATIPSGALLVRNPENIKEIETLAPYLTLFRQTALSGTRGSAAVASTYAAMRALGRRGYSRIVQQCMVVTNYAADKAKSVGLEIVKKPVMNVLGIYMPTAPSKIQAGLDEKGWKVSVATNPECLRLVIMPHVTKQKIDELFADLQEVLAGV